MRDHHVGTVVVVDGEKRDRPTGILTDRDIVVSAVAQSPDKVGSLLVGDVMTRDVITTRPATTLRSALSTMHSRGIRRFAGRQRGRPPGRADGVRRYPRSDV
jgi:CBS domain-containing protein